MLKRRSVDAEATAEVYLFVAEFLQLVSDSHVFQVSRQLLRVINNNSLFSLHCFDADRQPATLTLVVTH